MAERAQMAAGSGKVLSNRVLAGSGTAISSGPFGLLTGSVKRRQVLLLLQQVLLVLLLLRGLPTTKRKKQRKPLGFVTTVERGLSVFLLTVDMTEIFISDLYQLL